VPAGGSRKRCASSDDEEPCAASGPYKLARARSGSPHDAAPLPWPAWQPGAEPEHSEGHSEPSLPAAKPSLGFNNIDDIASVLLDLRKPEAPAPAQPVLSDGCGGDVSGPLGSVCAPTAAASSQRRRSASEGSEGADFHGAAPRRAPGCPAGDSARALSVSMTSKEESAPAQQCTNCSATKTPLWRRDRATGDPLVRRWAVAACWGHSGRVV
jgi:hypothetical protein